MQNKKKALFPLNRNYGNSKGRWWNTRQYGNNTGQQDAWQWYLVFEEGGRYITTIQAAMTILVIESHFYKSL